ncbi:MAG: lytic murein transglycosylase [Hoeflea sp.]|uniref:lytic murein transglycosylase n=1 Tax=Hoeflea sp. TaxID=1940281 RepID=UPI001D93A88F|nr:lytic murein transglycosylase [Hoeflea sp.]MBU4531615.1 lytic murein transglycosylase [Alphaproteobacteria bacterium]MBU4544472.1 lytic murein transglycosylase [Alphaproteobacteria bacterium]MBU4552703.1 lytic murein transglycosylase [Alphaproteobacteria bacterium]MBV1724891.1 lytic murein transglycosylase [Hoeflea sp.]MBV1760911.1 lytic murein transglycosylase [Hoeflea sp.]
MIRTLILSVFCIAAAFTAQPSHAATKAGVEAQFRQWLDADLWPEASRSGVSRAVFDRAFSGISLDWDLPDLAPPGFPKPKERAQSQAEFRSPGAYFSEKSLQGLAASGRSLMKQHAGTLARIEQRYGVPASIIVAIWGRESGFGRARIPHSAVRVLVTKAFMSTRTDLFRREILAALKILERGDIPASAMKSSWAGAMGQPQFLPSSYLDHAVDFDGDGKRDIWNSVPDSLAAIANYLAQSGWVRGRDWGFEAVIPQGVTCALEGPDRARPIAALTDMGIIRISGRPFPDHERSAPGMVLVPAGTFGPEFVVTPNFYVIKEYNNSDLYALFIGNLADRIAHGGGAFVTPWRSTGSMLRSDIARLQSSLESQGYDVGGADGLPGYKTRRSIGEWQGKNGETPTCFPTPALLKSLR